jgi:hypothetical protein
MIAGPAEMSRPRGDLMSPSAPTEGDGRSTINSMAKLGTKTTARTMMLRPPPGANRPPTPDSPWRCRTHRMTTAAMTM